MVSRKSPTEKTKPKFKYAAAAALSEKSVVGVLDTTRPTGSTTSSSVSSIHDTPIDSTHATKKAEEGQKIAEFPYVIEELIFKKQNGNDIVKVQFLHMALRTYRLKIMLNDTEITPAAWYSEKSARDYWRIFKKTLKDEHA